MKIRIITTGGTIDKVYFDRKSTYEVGDPQVGEVLDNADVNLEFEVETLFRKDSLDMTDEDRRAIRDRIEADPGKLFIVTHGTDTMTRTATALQGLQDKVVVMTGSQQPARFYNSNAIFNIGGAVAAVQILSPGVYIVMNGRVFDADKVRKDPKTGRFEET